MRPEDRPPRPPKSPRRRADSLGSVPAKRSAEAPRKAFPDNNPFARKVAAAAVAAFLAAATRTAPLAAPEAVEARSAGANASIGADAKLPPPLQRDLEDAVREKITTIVEEKNDVGVPFRRASYSMNFRAQADGTYQTILHVDTATLENMKTERFLILLRKDPAKGDWKVADQTLQDTFQDAYRDVFDDKHFRTFDS